MKTRNLLYALCMTSYMGRVFCFLVFCFIVMPVSLAAPSLDITNKIDIDHKNKSLVSFIFFKRNIRMFPSGFTLNKTAWSSGVINVSDDGDRD